VCFWRTLVTKSEAKHVSANNNRLPHSTPAQPNDGTINLGPLLPIVPRDKTPPQ